jgi:hypothetical protein
MNGTMLWGKSKIISKTQPPPHLMKLKPLLRTRSTLYKTHSWVLIFCNRRIARVLLIRICKSLGIKYRGVPLDQKTRWSSTERMVRIWRNLKQAVQSVQATQTFDTSLKGHDLHDKDWEVLDDISRFFGVFARAFQLLKLMNILHFKEPSPNISLSCENSNHSFLLIMPLNFDLPLKLPIK